MDIFQKWQRAQEKERSFHGNNTLDKLIAYEEGYAQYFKYLDTTLNQKGKTIIEIGCADVPALHFCNGYKKGIIIEPLPSDLLNQLIKDKPITVIEKAAENVSFPKVDEIWLFNVLQHVIDPTVIIEQSKESANIIRFFEPINDGIDECHLHSFTLDYFKEHFGGVTQYYPSHVGRVKNFHEHECAYGVWKKI